MKNYYAFISYRHADNRQEGRLWATWLHQSLESYEIPEDLVGKTNLLGEKIPSQIFPIFRDEEELPANADLSNAISRALDNSQTLIVLCSPHAVASKYVAKEIDYFKKLGRSSRIIAAIIDGEPNISQNRTKQLAGLDISAECFPRPLQFKYNDNGQATQAREEPLAADFRLNMKGKHQQGWTTPAALELSLKQSGNFNSRSIRELRNRYAEQQHLMLMKIIAGILAIPLGKLTQRDKEYRLQREKAKRRALIRWFSAISFLLVLLFIASMVAIHMKNQVELSDQNNQILEVTKNTESARYFLTNRQPEKAINLLARNLPFLPESQRQHKRRILSYLLQPYISKDRLPAGALEDQQLYNHQGNVVFYRDGEKHTIMTGSPSMAYVDTCQQRIFLGFDNTPTPSLHIFDSLSFKPLYTNAWDNEQLVFDGPPIPLSDNNYLLPTYIAGSYAGANYNMLYYLELPYKLTELRQGNIAMPSFSESLDRIYLLYEEGMQHLEPLNNLATSRVRVKKIDDGFQLTFKPMPTCQEPLRWQRLYGGEQSTIHRFPLPYQLMEEDIWHEQNQDAIYFGGVIGSDAGSYALDYRHGTLHHYSSYVSLSDFSYFIDYLWHEKILSINADKAFSMHMDNTGRHGSDFQVCTHQLKQPAGQITQKFVDPSTYVTAKEDRWNNCIKLSEHQLYPNYLKQNPYSRYVPFRPGFFKRDRLLTLVDLKTSKVLSIEPPDIKALDFDFIAFANDTARFVGLFGDHLLIYHLNPVSNLFEIQAQSEFLLNSDTEQLLSMQLDSRQQALMLFDSGQVISVNPENGLVNWQIHLNTNGKNSYLLASEDQRFFGVVNNGTFILLDAAYGMQLSEPFVFTEMKTRTENSIDDSEYFDDSPLLEYMLINSHGEVDIGIYSITEMTHAEIKLETGETFQNLDSSEIQTSTPTKVHLRRFNRPAPPNIQLDSIQQRLVELNMTSSEQ